MDIEIALLFGLKMNKEEGLFRAVALRGGSWNNPDTNLRCSARNNNDPDNDWNNEIGFRVVSPAQSCPTGNEVLPVMPGPDAGVLRNTGLLSGHDIRPSIRRPGPVPCQVWGKPEYK
jgi:hypothetical protein